MAAYDGFYYNLENSGPGYIVVDMAQVKMPFYIEICENCFCHENICPGYQDNLAPFFVCGYVSSNNG